MINKFCKKIIFWIIICFLFVILFFYLFPSVLGLAIWSSFDYGFRFLNKIDNFGDPCYELDYPGKGPRYEIRDNYVCVDNMKAKHCIPAGWGDPCLTLNKKVNGADPKTFIIHYGTLATDKDNVYINGEKTDFDVAKFKYEDDGYDNYFYIGDDKYRLHGMESGYDKVN